MTQFDMGPRRKRRENFESLEITSELDGEGTSIAFVSPDASECGGPVSTVEEEYESKCEEFSVSHMEINVYNE